MLKGTMAVALGALAFVMFAGVERADAQSKCTAKQLKSTGKAAFKRANCYSKAVKKADNSGIAACEAAENTKLTDAFSKADDTADCETAATAGQAISAVDDFIADLTGDAIDG